MAALSLFAAVLPERVSDAMRRLQEWRLRARGGATELDAVPDADAEWHSDATSLCARLAALSLTSGASTAPPTHTIQLLAQLVNYLRSARNTRAHRARLAALWQHVERVRARLARPAMRSDQLGSDNAMASGSEKNDQTATTEDADDDDSLRMFVQSLVDLSLASECVAQTRRQVATVLLTLGRANVQFWNMSSLCLFTNFRNWAWTRNVCVSCDTRSRGRHSRTHTIICCLTMQNW